MQQSAVHGEFPGRGPVVLFRGAPFFHGLHQYDQSCLFQDIDMMVQPGRLFAEHGGNLLGRHGCNGQRLQDLHPQRMADRLNCPTV
jgi:hypothetical protein